MHRYFVESISMNSSNQKIFSFEFFQHRNLKTDLFFCCLLTALSTSHCLKILSHTQIIWASRRIRSQRGPDLNWKEGVAVVPNEIEVSTRLFALWALLSRCETHQQRVSSWCDGKSEGLRNRSKRVRTPVALLRSLSGKYPWERYEPPYPPSYGLNSTITVLLGK